MEGRLFWKQDIQEGSIPSSQTNTTDPCTESGRRYLILNQPG